MKFKKKKHIRKNTNENKNKYFGSKNMFFARSDIKVITNKNVQTLLSPKIKQFKDINITTTTDDFRKNVQQRRTNILSAKLINEIYTHLPFDDPIFKSRIKERLWSELMLAKKSGLSFFLQTCRQFAKDVLLGSHPELISLITYFDFIKVYLKNDFLSFALTKFCVLFKSTANTFFNLSKTSYCFSFKKGSSLRLSLAVFTKHAYSNFRYFVLGNSFYFGFLKMVQFFFSMFLFSIPKHFLFKKPDLNVLHSFRFFFSKFKSLDFVLKNEMQDHSSLPLWQQPNILELLNSARSAEVDSKLRIVHEIDELFYRLFIKAWNNSAFRVFFTQIYVPKPQLEFAFWEEIDPSMADLEFSTQVYTPRPDSLIYPLKSNASLSLFNNSDFRLLPFFFMPSLVTFFGAKLPNFCNSSIISPGFVYTLDNLIENKNSLNSNCFTILFSNYKLYKLFDKLWIPFVWNVFFGDNLLSGDFLSDIETRTLNLLSLPFFTNNSLLYNVKDLFEPYYFELSKNRKFLWQALGFSNTDVLTIFYWLDKTQPFSDVVYHNVLSKFVNNDYTRYMSFPLLFPNERVSEIMPLPVMNFNQSRLRRRRFVSASFERHNSPKVFGKFMTVLIKDGMRSRAQRLIQLSLCMLKSMLQCQSSRRVFLGAARQISPQLLTTSVKRGGRNLTVFLRTKVHRLWAKGIKNLGVSVEIRRLENWQEKNYNYAWALADEIFDVMQLKYDCFSYQLSRHNIRLLTELRKTETRRRGMIIGDRNSYQRLYELRSMSSPKSFVLNKKKDSV